MLHGIRIFLNCILKPGDFLLGDGDRRDLIGPLLGDGDRRRLAGDGDRRLTGLRRGGDLRRR